MKKVFTLMLALAIGFGLKAQCPLTTAVDFTATDCHGTEVHLFDILDGGQAVLIDFFYTTCGPCQQATPKIAESYTIMGCNMHDVYYVEITPYDANAACQNWVNNYGIEYPTIGTTGGGAAIVNQYQIGAFPTVILIMPDRSIVINDLWPISNAQTIVTQLGQHGVMPHDCNPAVTYDPQVAISIDEVTANSITATFTPNEDCASYYYLVATESEINAWIAMGEDFEQIIEQHGGTETATFTYTATELNPDTEYKVLALPVDPDDNYGEIAQETVITLLPIIYDETLAFSMDTVVLPWCEVTWITVYNYTAEDATIVKICDEMAELEYYIGENSEILPTCYETEIVIPQGGSIELGIQCCVTGKSIVPDVVTISSNLPNAQFVVMVDDTWSVEENAVSISLFPNPANESVTLKGENLGTVRVFNVMGQKMDEFEANGTELNINTAGYENGIYFVKAGEQTLRFVVKH